MVLRSEHTKIFILIHISYLFCVISQFAIFDGSQFYLRAVLGACDEAVCAKINLRDIVHCVDCKYQISLNPFFRDVMLCGLIEIHIHCG